MFNPSELTVKEARARLGDLDIDGLKTEAAEEAAEEVVEEAAAPEPGITQMDWYRLRRHEKGLLTICSDGLYRKK